MSRFFSTGIKDTIFYLMKVLSFPPQNILHHLSLIPLTVRKTPSLAGYLQGSLLQSYSSKILSQKNFFFHSIPPLLFTSFLLHFLLSLISLEGGKNPNTTTLQNHVHYLDSYLSYTEDTILSRFNLFWIHTLLTKLFITTDF